MTDEACDPDVLGVGGPQHRLAQPGVKQRHHPEAAGSGYLDQQRRGRAKGRRKEFGGRRRAGFQSILLLQAISANKSGESCGTGKGIRIDPRRQVDDRSRAHFGNFLTRHMARSPPWRSEVGTHEPLRFAFLALLIEAMFGYPDTVLAPIGHPVTWMGRIYRQS